MSSTGVQAKPARCLWKCDECRRNKKRCDPPNREWPEKCQTCLAKGLDCSEPRRVRKPQYARRTSTPAPSTSSGSSRAQAPVGICGTRATDPDDTVPDEAIAADPDPGATDLISLVPCRRDPNFTGRKAQLERLQDIFNTSHGHHRAAITGFLGVGKTQLAIEFAHQTYAKTLQPIIWLSAQSLSEFEKSCQSVISTLGFKREDGLFRSASDLLHLWLCELKETKCLVIIDHVNNIELTTPTGNDHAVSEILSPVDLLDFLPRSSYVSVLMTTRSRKVARQLNDEFDEKLYLGPMNQSEALQLLRNKTHNDRSAHEQQQKLVDLLEYLPIAITQATIHMFESNIQVSTYVEHLSRNKVKLLKWKVRYLKRDCQLRTSILETIEDTLDYLSETEPLAMGVLSQMSVLHHCGIPRTLLNYDDARSFDLDEAIGFLVDLSMISEEPRTGNYSLLCILQLATQAWLKRNQRLNSVIEQTLALLSTKFPSGNFEDWDGCRKLEPHARQVLSLAIPSESADRSGGLLYYKLARYGSSTGRLTLASQMIMKSQHLQQRSAADGLPDLAEVYRLMAVIYAKSGNYQKAEDIISKRLHQNVQSSNRVYPASPVDRTSLAALHFCQGTTQTGYRVLKNTRVDSSNTTASSSTEDLAATETMAAFNVYRRHVTGGFGQVIKLYQQALDEKQKTYDLGHPSTLATKNNLAIFSYYNNSLVDDQLIRQSIFQMHQQVLDAQDSSLGTVHPSTLASRSSLAVLSYDQASYDCPYPFEQEHLAILSSRRMHYEETLDRVIQQLEELLGAGHPLTLLESSNKAMLMFLRGDHSRAEKMQEDVVDALRKVSTDRNPQLRISIRNLNDMRQEREYSLFGLEPIPLVAMEPVDTILVCWAHMLSFMQGIELDAQAGVGVNVNVHNHFSKDYNDHAGSSTGWQGPSERHGEAADWDGR